MSDLLRTLQGIGLRDVADILLISSLFYLMFRLIRGTTRNQRTNAENVTLASSSTRSQRKEEG